MQFVYFDALYYYLVGCVIANGYVKDEIQVR